VDCYRNSKVWDIVNELKEYGIDPVISDPVADAPEAKRIYGVEFADMSMITDMDAIILAVAHDEFKSLEKADMDKLYGPGKKVLLDVKGILKTQDYADYSFWRL
jgi:UDP-N-acetyl-D-galactosamine dehydrogenase